MRRLALAAALVAGAALALPAAAAAHGLGVRVTLPIPAYLFAWAAAIVLIASFAALAALWPRPRLVEPRRRVLLELGPARRALEPLAGALGVALFALVVYAGLAGEQADPDRNLAPNVVYVLFWVGLPVASALLGDVFAAFNPWRALARAGGAALAATGVRRKPRPYPERVGHWPAVAVVLAFVWVELAVAEQATPAVLAWLALAYAAVQLAACAVFGVEAWDRRGDGFAVYFRLFSRIAPLSWKDGRLVLRRPLEGLARMQSPPGTVALLVVAIGSTAFDGLSRGTLWREASAQLEQWLGDAGVAGHGAEYLVDSVGIALMVGLVAAIYAFGVAGMLRVGVRHDRAELARRFAHSLVPIGLAYVVAHYLTLLLYQGQAFASLLSDPLGDGSDLLGTAGAGIDLTLLSAGAIWAVQLVALIGGHVSGLVLAHERSLLDFPRPYDATRSQYWALAVMVGFTCLGLWLLESAA